MLAVHAFFLFDRSQINFKDEEKNHPLKTASHVRLFGCLSVPVTLLRLHVPGVNTLPQSQCTGHSTKRESHYTLYSQGQTKVISPSPYTHSTQMTLSLSLHKVSSELGDVHTDQNTNKKVHLNTYHLTNSMSFYTVDK